MEQLPQPGHPDHSYIRRDGQPGDAGVGPSTLKSVRSTTYEGIGVGGNAQAHFGDKYQQSHGFVISKSPEARFRNQQANQCG